MKSRSRTVTVGRNLRRYLGALLAVGFGVSWWSFMPPAMAATPKPQPRIAQRAPSAAAQRVASVPTFTPKTVEVLPVAIDQPTPPKPRPVKRPKKVVPPVKTPPPIVEPQMPPVVETPVVETPVVETPVVETPVVETPPVVEPVDDPYLSPIITRSS